ncbi:hypothetical protein MAR_037499 [Mya arenaria]|uniref:Uncharacterized protein n=1 Tax=Mya arenaria TaxID=6604 RepID=A0ABY7FNM4_MYAAR|nr:uncharacterized protein LOC128215571 [Mya arenaria]WAR23830.1 hypothetical protein MAR_037499 [Mya arenaria]
MENLGCDKMDVLKVTYDITDLPELKYFSKRIQEIIINCQKMKAKIERHTKAIVSKSEKIFGNISIMIFNKDDSRESRLSVKEVISLVNDVTPRQQKMHEDKLSRQDSTLESGEIRVDFVAEGCLQKYNQCDHSCHRSFLLSSSGKYAVVDGKAAVVDMKEIERVLVTDIYNKVVEVAEHVMFESLQGVLQALQNRCMPNKKRANYGNPSQRNVYCISSEDQEIVLELIAEARHVFKSSCLSGQKMWGILDEETDVIVQLDEKTARKILESNKYVYGCGLKGNQLQIDIDERALKDVDNDEERHRKILKRLLRKHGISNYTTNYGFFKLEPFTCTIGSKISCGQGSRQFRRTLGGFAEKGRKLYALTARHFLIEDKVHLIIEMNNTEISQPLGQVEQGRVENKGELDIAAVLIHPNITIPEDDKMLKDSEGTIRQSILFPFQEKIPEIINELTHQAVHIWGSESKPGLGKITIPEYFVNGLQNKLVVVEDKLFSGEDDRFGKKGDSGSIICSDDIAGQHVNVYCMLMGSDNNAAVHRDTRERRRYLTFRMEAGILQLNQELGGRFKLC